MPLYNNISGKNIVFQTWVDHILVGVRPYHAGNTCCWPVSTSNNAVVIQPLEAMKGKLSGLATKAIFESIGSRAVLFFDPAYYKHYHYW